MSDEEFRSYIEPNYHPSYYYPEISLLAAFGPVYIYAPNFDYMKMKGISPREFINNVRDGFYRPVAAKWYWEKEGHKKSPIPWDKKYIPELEQVLEERLQTGLNYPDLPKSNVPGWVTSEISGKYNELGVQFANDFIQDERRLQDAIHIFRSLPPDVQPAQYTRYRTTEEVLKSVRWRVDDLNAPKAVRENLDTAIVWRCVYDFTNDLFAIAPYNIDAPHYLGGWVPVISDLYENVVTPSPKEPINKTVFQCAIRCTFMHSAKLNQISNKDLKKLDETGFRQGFARLMNISARSEESPVDSGKQLFEKYERDLKKIKSFHRKVLFSSALLGAGLGAAVTYFVVKHFPISEESLTAWTEMGAVAGGTMLTEFSSKVFLPLLERLQKKSWVITFEQIS